MILEPVCFVLPISLPLPPSPLPQLYQDGFCENHLVIEVSKIHFVNSGLVHIQHKVCKDEGTYYH